MSPAVTGAPLSCSVRRELPHKPYSYPKLLFRFSTRHNITNWSGPPTRRAVATYCFFHPFGAHNHLIGIQDGVFRHTYPAPCSAQRRDRIQEHIGSRSAISEGLKSHEIYLAYRDLYLRAVRALDSKPRRRTLNSYGRIKTSRETWWLGVFASPRCFMRPVQNPCPSYRLIAVRSKSLHPWCLGRRCP